MNTQEDFLETLKATSRTFFLPIQRLPVGLQEAVAAGYLCMRAIDEIEDHERLERATKSHLLRLISQLLQEQTDVETFAHARFTHAFAELQASLPAVTLHLSRWACAAPEMVAPRIWDATAAMAERMACWVTNGWSIHTEADLDHYTYSSAGAVGLLLCDLWAWFTGEQLHRAYALQFGRGLQAVNILRNRRDDLMRGVDFFPDGWTSEQMARYAYRHLQAAEAYARDFPSAAFPCLIEIPLALAYGTLDALARGEAKLSRESVQALLQHIDGGREGRK